MCLKASVVVCDHVLAREKPDVIFVRGGVITDAFCFECADALQAIIPLMESPAHLPMADKLHGACAVCVSALVGSALAADGVWIRSADGTYGLQKDFVQ